MRTHPPIFARLASDHPRSSEVVKVARLIYQAENERALRRHINESIQRLLDYQRHPRFNNYRPDGGDER